VIVNVHEAKTRLSQLLKHVEAGEEVVIARHGTPVAQLVKIEARPARKLGLLQGTITVAPDFDDWLPEFEESIERPLI